MVNVNAVTRVKRRAVRYASSARTTPGLNRRSTRDFVLSLTTRFGVEVQTHRARN